MERERKRGGRRDQDGEREREMEKRTEGSREGEKKMENRQILLSWIKWQTGVKMWGTRKVK